MLLSIAFVLTVGMSEPTCSLWTDGDRQLMTAARLSAGQRYASARSHYLRGLSTTQQANDNADRARHILDDTDQHLALANIRWRERSFKAALREYDLVLRNRLTSIKRANHCGQ